MNKIQFDISEKTKFKRATGLICSQIDKETAILSIENEEYYFLNDVGSLIWEYLSEPKTITKILVHLKNTYTVSDKVCRKETTEYLSELISLGIVQTIE